MMTAYRTTILADGQDRALLRVALTDSAGREITSAAGMIRIYVDGDARITLTGQKDPLTSQTDTAGRQYSETRLANGLCYLDLYAGTVPGKVKVEVMADTLWPSSHEIHTIPADVALLKPDPGQIVKPGKTIDRMIGADISFLPQLESRGLKFFDQGVEKDAIEILRDHGFNYIRLRIFVNPENENGYAPGEGYCGLAYTLGMAKRIHEAGMKILLNFHYSDYWADPQQQYKPEAWAELDFESLKDTLRAYTADVLRAFSAQGTPPAMVQVGNEVNHGLLWPDGHISQPDKLAELLRAGVEGVLAVDPEMPVMMHIALGGQNEEAVFWLDNMIARGVPFDVIGLSYYPRWHGTLDDLKANLLDLTERYHKYVNVVEYSIFRKEVNEIVFSLPEDMGKGTCIWEPLGRWG
jgi:beta-galactosidase